MTPPVVDHRRQPPRKSKFTRPPKLLVIIVCATLLLLSSTFFTPGLQWSGGTWAEVKVHVTDAVTKQPLSRVSLQFVNDNGTPTGQMGTTNGSGFGTVNVLVGAGGTRSRFYQSMGYGRSDRVILVQIPGYADALVAPGHGQTFSIFGIGPKPKLNVEVAMKRLSRTTTEPTSSP